MRHVNHPSHTQVLNAQLSQVTAAEHQKGIKTPINVNKAGEALSKTASKQVQMQHPSERVKEVVLQKQRATSNHRGKSGDGSKSVLNQPPNYLLPSGFDNQAAIALMTENPKKAQIIKQDWNVQMQQH